MKKIITTILVSAIFCSFSIAQTVTGTIKDMGSNTVTVFAKSTADINYQVGNINIVISIPDQTLTAGTNPTDAEITKTVNVTNAKIDNGTGVITNPTIIGNRAYYTYLLFQNNSTDVSAGWLANTEYPVISFTFPTNTFFPNLQLNDLTSASGGPNQQMYWYVQFNTLNDVTNYITPFYGTGAVNNGGSAEQFVPLDQTTPVKFLGFSATKKDNAAVLNWSIENESALTASYEVERSFNGVDFIKIATVAVKNNGSASNSYDLTDNNLSSVMNGVVYYRIKQIDKDGKSIYTTIKSVRFTGKGTIVGVYPNPVKATANLTIDVTEDKAVSVFITDATGKEINHIQLQAFKGLNTKKIDMSNLASGSYMFKVQAGTEITTIPVLKAK